MLPVLPALDVLQHEARRVPELVAEVAVSLDTAEIETDVPALGSKRAECEAQRVGAVGGNSVGKLPAGGRYDARRELRLHEAGGALGNELVESDSVAEVEGIEDVALRLRHLVAVRVANEAVDVDLPKGHVPHELEPEHDHPGDPEEDDVEAGNQHRGRVEGAQPRVVLRPAERREGPEGRGVPGVEHVRIPAQRGIVGHAVLHPHLVLTAPDVHVSVGVVPGGNPVSPPDLAADAPVLNVPHPLEVGLRPMLGHESDCAAFDGFYGGLGEGSGPDEPLIRQIGLDHGLGPVASRHDVTVGFDFLDQLPGFEVGNDALTCREAFEPTIARRSVVVDACVRSEDVDLLERVALTRSVVVEVVRRGDLDATAAESGIHHFIGDDRNPAVDQGQVDFPAHVGPVALVIGMHRDRGVAQHRFGAGRGDRSGSRSRRRGGSGCARGTRPPLPPSPRDRRLRCAAPDPS